jgi:rare lipoprotein A
VSDDSVQKAKRARAACRSRPFTLHSSLFTGVSFCLALGACTSLPPRPENSGIPRPGAYYLDDGPGANPPVNLEQITDAEPRDEPIKASTARPYTVFGRTYSPMSAAAPYKVRGRASWYGKRYHGQPTASGEIYDMYAMTAAHPTLPIPSYARVTNLRNDKSVVVRINDRGPFHSDRLIDLSYAAAYKLGIVQSGSDLVEIEAILPSAARPPSPAGLGEQAAVDMPATAVKVTAPTDAVDASSDPQQAEPAGVYVQLGAFAARQNAERFLVRMRSELNWLAQSLALFARDGVYRVNAGPYAHRGEASRIASQIEQTTALRPVLLIRQINAQ